jgi:hypothetical protein
MAADRVLKTLAAAILFSGAASAVFAQQLDAAAPSPQPMPGFSDGNATRRCCARRKALATSRSSY